MEGVKRRQQDDQPCSIGLYHTTVKILRKRCTAQGWMREGGRGKGQEAAFAAPAHLARRAGRPGLRSRPTPPAASQAAQRAPPPPAARPPRATASPVPAPAPAALACESAFGAGDRAGRRGRGGGRSGGLVRVQRGMSGMDHIGAPDDALRPQETLQVTRAERASRKLRGRGGGRRHPLAQNRTSDRICRSRTET